MVLRIRLARFGKKHSPFYNIVVAHARTARNSRPLEVLGTYDPIPKPPRPGDTHGRPWKDVKLDISRARYWVGVGAQPSDTAWRLLSMVGILEPQYRISQIQGKVIKADSAAKSLIPPSTSPSASAAPSESVGEPAEAKEEA
ncbi:ribosomal protein S16 [Trematosphaeria pertusa]|uniref:Ribosomal protein S16 n=1 Tax=Trematosphaeria pertusa TaxID=390896 RepID=A0A6A6IMF2_9PLEO|nr:ribosomal protein S16 [Trematosphaeria pertusa]KAF2251409.1 ribosomal protein S16 [Trematosphaeria pertusa]